MRETCLHCEAPIDNNRSAFGAKFCSYVCEEDMERRTKRDLVAKLNIVLNAFTVCEAVAGDTPPLFANTQAQADWHRAREAQKLTVLLAQAMLLLLEEKTP